MIKNINGAAVADDTELLTTPLNFLTYMLKKFNLIKQDSTVDYIINRLHSIDYEQSLVFNENPADIHLKQLIDVIISGLQPFVSMIRDLENYLEPYNSYNDLFTDVLQPIRGLLNCLRALINILLLPVYLTIISVLSIANAFIEEEYEGLLNVAVFMIICGTQGLLDSISSFIRGVQQIATTPFEWLVKIPTRSLHTAISGFQPIEKNPDIIRLVNKMENGNINKNEYAKQVAKIFLHYHEKGYKTFLNKEDISKIKQDGGRTTANAYSKTILSIFSNTPVEENNTPNETSFSVGR